MTPENVESLLSRTQGPEPPDRVERTILAEARYRLSGYSPTTRILGRLFMAASLLVCAGILWTLIPRLQDAGSLVEKLRSDSFEEREEASRKLKALGKEAQSVLEKAARDPDAEVAQRAKAILRVIATREKLTPHLIETFPGLDDRLAVEDRRSWSRVLDESLTDSRLTGPDLDALAREGFQATGTGPERRDLLDRFLERRVEFSDPAPGLRDVLKALGTNLPEDRRMKAWAFGAFGLTDATPEVVALLGDSNPWVRQTALWACRKLGVRQAIPRMIEILSEPVGPEPADAADPETRMAYWGRNSARFEAVHALASLGAAEAVPVLAALFKEEWAILEKGKFTHMPRDLAGALGRLGAEKEALAILAAPARNSKTSVRHQAIWSLSHLATPGARAELVELLNDSNADIRISALGALGQHPMKEAAPDVARRLDDPIAGVRESAVWTLRAFDARSFADVIALRLGDPDQAVRLRAAEVLAEIGRREGVPTVLEQIWDDKPQKQITFLRALDALNGVRQPALYASLREKAYKGRGVGRPREIVERVALQMGLKLEVCAEKEAEWQDSGSIGFGAMASEQTLESYLLNHAGTACGFILESDRIRLVTPTEALAFWKAWWAQAKKDGK